MQETDLKSWTRAIVACARRVHRELGCGFEAFIYEEALCLELDKIGIPYTRDLLLPVRYKGEEIGEHPFPFAFDNRVVASISTQSRFSRSDRDQFLSLLQFFNLRGGILLHFGSKRIRCVEVVNEDYKRFPFSLN
jgi:GxxExxY protein